MKKRAESRELFFRQTPTYLPGGAEVYQGRSAAFTGCEGPCLLFAIYSVRSRGLEPRLETPLLNYSVTQLLHAD
jgi:hypothetical protein